MNIPQDVPFRASYVRGCPAVKEAIMFRGSIPALVTIFRDEAFDEGEFRDFVDWQIAEGSHGLVPCGTTGESATLDAQEHYRVVEVCVEQAAGRVPVIAGCGSNSTAVAIQNMKAAKERGADAALIVLPYYNRPSQDGLVAHFTALTEGCDLPIVVYNVPSRTVTDILPETLGRIAALPNVVGIKDACGNLARCSAHRALCGPEFILLSGNDDMALGFNAMGGTGCISVSANVAPRLCADFQNACLEGRWEDALALNDRLYPLHAALFSDASPGPTKYALSRIKPGFPDGLRLPMTPPNEASRRAVDAALEHAGLA
jgi:4-hydroxy-tetrahydrodipicolinate synthase